MNSVQVPKKPAICKYFLTGETCPYGQECQFQHKHLLQPFSKEQSSNGFITSDMNGVVSQNFAVTADGTGGEHGDTGDANNGDQFFNATFNSAVPNPMPSDMKHFLLNQQQARIRGRKPTINMVTPLINSSVGSGASTGPQLPPPFVSTLNQMEKSAVDKFAALNLAATSNNADSMLGGRWSEFVPKQSGVLPHSASTPSFSMYNTSSTIPNVSSSHQLVSKPVTTCSPTNSPRQSPISVRRNASPRRNGPSAKSATVQENVGGTTYFYKVEDFAPQYRGATLPNFSMFPGLPSHIYHMKVKSNMPSFFMPDELKGEILSKQALTLAQIDALQNSDIPTEVDNYNCLFPLEPARSNNQKSSTFGYQTSVFKALNKKDGLMYCLRRIHGFRFTVSAKCMDMIEIWKKMYHPNIVQLKEVFTTKAFNDHSLVFVYDYHAAADTLMARHFNNPPPPQPSVNGYSSKYSLDNRPFSATGKGSSTNLRQHNGLLAESLIWSYVVQLSSALRAIHAAGLACRAMDPTKIIIHSKSRLWVNCVGIFDVLTFDSSDLTASMIPRYQQDDLISLGKVILALACNSVQGIHVDQIQASMELVARNYSSDLKNLIMLLLMTSSRLKNINDIMPMIGARFYTQLDTAQLRNDVLENEVAREVENGRLFRLISKLGSMNDRAEYHMEAAWSETGDRYMLKLFRDYLFHQVDENGSPWLDMGHIVQSLNKLDSGSPDKVCLMSRDGQNVIIVTYTELKRCFETSFTELLNSSHGHTLYR